MRVTLLTIVLRFAKVRHAFKESPIHCWTRLCFIAWTRNWGIEVIEDVKGVETPEFKLKRHLMKALLGWEVRVIK